MYSGPKARVVHRAWQCRRVMVVLALVVALTLSAVAQNPAPAPAATQSSESRLQDQTFQSESLARPMKYRILLPGDYFHSDRSYPVLYLLHGWHGDYQNWSTLTNLTQNAKDVPLIIVMPDAGDSWYVNSASTAQDKFETYIARDLINQVDQHWRTLRSSHRRAIAGLSMGGYGAVKFAQKFPEMFTFAGSISGAFNAPATELAEARADLRPSLMKAFGDANSSTRAENDVYRLLERTTSALNPYFYIDCGSSDSTFIASNRRLAGVLSQHKVPYEYHEHPGSHSWQYWDQRLPDLLKAVMQHIASDTSR